MQFVKSKKKSICLLLTLLFVVAAILLNLPLNKINSKAAANDPFQETLPNTGMSVTAYTKDGATTGTEKEGVAIKGADINQSIGCVSYNWKDIKYFKNGGNYVYFKKIRRYLRIANTCD